MINPFTTALMPVSQVVSWYLILKSSRQSLLNPNVASIALFYCMWALWKRYIDGNAQELGHISMGVMSVAAFSQKRVPSLVGALIVISNFILAVCLVFPMSLADLAEAVKHETGSWGILWAIIFKAYIASSTCLWFVILNKIYELPRSNAYTNVGETHAV